MKVQNSKRYKYYELFIEGVQNINEAINSGWNTDRINNSLIYEIMTVMSMRAETAK